jgi:hypothetical protein
MVPRSRIFLPWRWRRYVLPKRRLTQDLHSATSQKTTFFIVTAVKKGFVYHGNRHVPVTTRMTKTVLEPFKAVISTRFAQFYKRRPEQTSINYSELKRSGGSESGNEWGISQPQELTRLNRREDVCSPGGNGTCLRQSPIVSCYKWL